MRQLSVLKSGDVGCVVLVTHDDFDLLDTGSPAAVAASDFGAHGNTVAEFERAYGQVLFGFVRRLGVADAAAADVVQESLLRLFDVLRAGQPIRDLKAWTFHVAYRLAMDEHRRFARGHRLASAQPMPTPQQDAAVDIERQQVWTEVDRLPERQRAVLYLRFRADLAFDDIGLTLGITASAARSHCTQAIAVLRDRLSEGVPS